jgi:restriction endonuclease S subunit
MSEVKIDLNNLDKSNWKTYRFDEISKNISERVDPNNTDLKVYIGLEHIDSELIHIKRHGTPDDVNGQKLKFYKGDIIFGRRRAYQRKAGIATWDGFCSAHALVLRANPDVIDPELFPFFLHSDLFMNRAIDISVGSLSPTINWGTLKHQEFRVPPREEQEKFYELLGLIDQQVEQEKKLSEKLDILYLSIKKDFFSKDNDYPEMTLGDLVKIKSGDSPSKFKLNQDGSGIPFNKVADMNETTKYQNFAKEWAAPIESKIIKSGSVIFPKRGASIMTNKVRITEQDCHVDTNIMALSINDDSVLLNEYLYYFLLFKGLYKIADTAQIPQINNIHINPYPINLPPAGTQRLLVNKLNLVLDELYSVKCKINSTIDLKKVLVKRIL